MIAEQLKKSILQAAIQGKLTQQLPEDGDARNLLKEIQKEKARLIKEGKTKKEKPLPEITEDEIPFEIPENWCWVRLGNLCDYLQRGKSPIYSPIKKYPVIAQKCNQWEGFSIEKAQFIDPDTVKKYTEERTLKNEDLMWNSTGLGTLGRVAIYEESKNPYGFAVADSHVTVIRMLKHYVCPRYIFTCLSGPYIQSIVEDISSGSTKQKELLTSTIEKIMIPLPPMEEQKRILGCLEKLVPEIESLKNDETKLEELQKSFPKKMKDAILQYAIQGKLTQQLPEDGDARDLLKEIQKEKARLIKEGKIKKEKPLPEITEDEIQFEIPENWCWVRLGSIAFNHGQKKPDTEFTYIDISSINNSTNSLGDLNNILRPENAPSRARKIVHEGDVIYATVRPYLHNICVIDRKIEPEPIVSTGFAVVCTPMRILNFYLYKCFLSPMFDSYANDSDNSRGVAYPAINDDKFSKALIPLPPLAEQNRIIVRLEKLLLLCEELEK